MSTCKTCASLKFELPPESHSALRRQSVRQRFLDVSETYECLNCGSNWECIISTAERYAVRYRWRMVAKPIKPASITARPSCADLDNAVASWIKVPREEAVHA
jgi:hypothetical protein